MTVTRKRSLTGLGLVMLVIGAWFAQESSASAATYCNTYIASASFSNSTDKITAKGAAFCSMPVYATRVYVRIYRTDVTPAKSIAGNGIVCYSASTCPQISSNYVNVSSVIDNGCHPYEVRSGGWFTPHGEPPAIQFPSGTDSAGLGERCR
jgi:hypothetical protein